jgi:hypothetical protein
LCKFFTENVEKVNVAVSFLPNHVTDDEKRGYLKSLITPGMLHSHPHHVIFANNTKYLLIFVPFFLQTCPKNTFTFTVAQQIGKLEQENNSLKEKLVQLVVQLEKRPVSGK